MRWMGRSMGLGIMLLFTGMIGLIAQGIKPYLQTPSDTSIWITWKTDSNTESIVLYGVDSAALSNSVSGDCQILSDVGYDHNYFYHSVQLTGLEPGQYYYYRCVTGSLQSSIYRFRSQPSPGNSSGVYRFLVFGDHQVESDDRYERLLAAARDKIFEKYGGAIEEHVQLVINDGDQVDQGNLHQYEFIHFGPSSELSGNVPIMTTVGNHETYGSLGLSAYYTHFFYDNLKYKGISSPGGENYYAYQEKNIVFVHLSSEHTTDAQVTWVQQIVDSVKIDPQVDWVVSVGHRPIQAEQFVGDISKYIRDRIIPVLAQSEKSSLFIGGHHHLYARGQVRDYPMYHIISGGGSWDQFWGQSVEKDFDDVQKTIDYWTYQIVTVDAALKEMVVECYAIGSPKLGITLDNILIDSFYRKLPAIQPHQPAITVHPADSIELPFTFECSPYASDTDEPLNSVQYQIASDPGFTNPEIDLIRDFENLYGTTGSPDYLPVDIHKDLNILQYTIGRNALPNGTFKIRVRHRDRNITWSEWSDPVEFMVKGSAGGFTAISTSKSMFRPEESIAVNYNFGPGNANDWIGIYRIGETPGTTPSTDWQYVDGSSGTVHLKVPQSGKYYIAFFEDEGYSEIADRVQVFIVSEPDLSMDRAGYDSGDEISIQYANAPAFNYDWIGIYKLNDIPGNVSSTLWAYTTGTSGEISFSGLEPGYYFFNYFIENIYIEAGDRIIFSVGTDLATVSSEKPVYHEDESIGITFENAPGLSTDWIGIFRQNAPPGTAPLVEQQFINGLQSGNLTFNLELVPGPYFAALFINNSNFRISNVADFTVESGTSAREPMSDDPDVSIFPSPSSGHLKINASGLPPVEMSLRILSLTGRSIYEKSEIPGSDYTIDLDLSGQTPGIYFVYLKAGNHIFVKKLVFANPYQ